MSLKKKIILGFLISSVIIAVLAVSEFVNFIEIRKEIGFLELADTLRSKSLQLRRHEKNFFLYGDEAESRNVHVYVADLRATLLQGRRVHQAGNFSQFMTVVDEYDRGFGRIESLKHDFLTAFAVFRRTHPQNSDFFPLVEATFLERPAVNAQILRAIRPSRENDPTVRTLLELDAEITSLRRKGEEILVMSKNLDRSARVKVDEAVSILQAAAVALFPLSFVIGLGTLSFLSQSVVSRLKILKTAIAKAGTGDFSSLTVPEKHDEVGALITSFNRMGSDLANRDIELARKNAELLQSRKLASIGTLASGVAHELNNPLNNIYISAQMLERETRDTASPQIKEIVNDIVGQTLRVKGIVADLLEFARGKEPAIRRIDLAELVAAAYRLLSLTTDMTKVTLSLDTEPGGVFVDADPEQLERVFINLFANAADAMSASGTVTVRVSKAENVARAVISDTGKGMSAEAVEKIFEPFYTTKDKGTGLGLAIVFNIIKKHGGDISAQSEQGKGTTFTVTLPLNRTGRTGE